ncbi:MAG: AraC family transcriptional regulator, partial [Bacteroidaceae bacterium]|nr:AraC family transcriptional regulator [Bacteroidaceae bacterium]
RLRFTDMTMQEIANDLNFANASFFGKFFKEHSGMTPLDSPSKPPLVPRSSRVKR